MNAIKNRIKKLETKAEVIKLFKSDVAQWALEYAKAAIEVTETNFENNMRTAYEAGRISVPLIFTFPDGEVEKRAKYYTKTYTNLEDCINGERMKNQRVKELMRPSILALKHSIEKDHGEIEEL